jgi:UDP-2-acetamido-3-amino-2,3-dideoxy-glucuronate N-acetyltransferase
VKSADGTLRSLVRRLRFPLQDDARGSLLPLDFGDLPFQPQRAFVTSVTEPRMRRGGHAHKRCRQLLISLGGAIDVEVAYRGERAVFRLEARDEGLLIEPPVWSQQTFTSASALLLVLASEPFDPAGYLDEGDASQSSR